MKGNDERIDQSRRAFLHGAVGAGMVAALPATGAQTADMPRQTEKAGTQSGEQGAGSRRLPNIVYIHSHDTGRYVRPYGHAVPTPNLQRLAGEGVLFRKAFSAAPTCSPSRASLLTGMCAHKNGMLGLAHRGWSLNDYQQHIIHTLGKSGYTSVLAGLQHIASKPETIGYDLILPHKTTSAQYVAPAAVEYLESNPKQPFFLDVGFFETHRQFLKPELPEDNPTYVMPPSPIPDTPQTREDMAGFHASARLMDKGVGDVMAALERNGMAENTIVLSTTDHGISFPEMKCGMRDGGWGVSMIMRGPGIFKAGTVCDALISQLDVFPTLCEYLGIDKPAWLEGTSFLPVLRGEKQEINEEVFAEVNYHAAYEPKRAVRTARWKYARRYDGRKTAVLPNCDEGLSKALWMKDGWQSNPLEHEEELYDLIFDPAEQNDLAKNEDHAAVLQEMRGRLDRWMKRTDDPLLRGPIALPPGVRTTDPNALTPEGSGPVRL
ncbi:MAG: sulfatase family protein [Acidobacteriaceae bacterium]